MKIKTSQKPKNYDVKKRVLISVSVLGSAGPLRLLVSDDDSAGRVIDTALKLYDRLGRIPVLGSDPDRFLLCYHDGAGSHTVLGREESVGITGARSFVLAKKPGPDPVPERGAAASSWKAWIHKSLSFNIMSH